MDKIIIKDLVARGIIGVNDWEREQPQEILINLVVLTDTRPAGASDSLTDCVSYKTLAHKVREHAETASRFTVEALANDVARICLDDKRVSGVLVRVEKPGAVRFCASVGVEIQRDRDESTP
jgi:FolB domain-containing protein